MGPINGKAERRSVMDLKVEDQRATPRVYAQFRARVSGPAQPEGTGIILDLSRSGCRLESPLLMLPGLSLELRIAVPGLVWALMIDGLMCSGRTRKPPGWLLFKNRGVGF